MKNNKVKRTNKKENSKIYKCKDNDAIIELAYPDELYIRIDGETSSIVIGLEELFNALQKFKVDKCTCNSDNYGYGFAKCYECGKIKTKL